MTVNVGDIEEATHTALTTMYSLAVGSIESAPTDAELAHAYNILAEYIGSDSRMRTCDNCNLVEPAEYAPDWPDGICPECQGLIS